MWEVAWLVMPGKKQDTRELHFRSSHVVYSIEQLLFKICQDD